jgi:D-alanyl-lipoteichoic acid acyltransferase DltB (MBOAT superfamily)
MPTGPILLPSLTYAAFVAAVGVLYFLMPRSGQAILLLLASYLFYGLWSRWFPPVLLVVTALDFLLPFAYRRLPRLRRVLLAAGIAANVGILVGLKYGAAVAPRLWGAFGLAPGTGLELAMRIVLPVGLSFYALQGIAYLVDTYTGQMPPSRDPIGFALYMAYFPKLLAGPIERPAVFLGQLDQDRTVDNPRLARSLTRVVIGLTRKLVIANALLAMSPADVFLRPADYPPVVLGTALVAFGFGLYNDFAGYTNIAQGVSGLFGIELSANFRQPMFSTTFTDVWNRWHISLSHWLRDYIYFPLTRALLRRRWGGQLGVIAFLPALVTMVVSGLWHGFSANMIVWGLAMGLLLGGERILHERFRWPGARTRTQTWRWLAPVIVTSVTLLLLVLFRSPLSAVGDYWRGLIGWRPWQWTSWGVPILAMVSLGLDALQARGGEATAFAHWPRLARAGLLAAAILAIFLATRGSVDPLFVYQGF